jgi:hypothetical protein
MKRSFYSRLSMAIFFGLGMVSSFSCVGQSADAPYSIREILNLSYYEDEALDSDLTQVNLLLPEGVENPPVFMWIGGGAWAYVDRHQEMDLCRKLATRGIAMVSVGHRLSPALLSEPKRTEGIKHPEHVKDVAQAFKWVYENAEKYGYDHANIFIGGFSSGAHLSTLLAMDNRYLKAVGLSNEMIRAIIPVGGGYDIPHYKEVLVEADPSYEENHINAVFGETHEEHLDASPITFIDSLRTPILMISESSTYQYSLVFEEILRERNYPDFEVLNVHNETHGSLWKSLSNDEENLYRDFMVGYIFRKTKAGT